MKLHPSLVAVLIGLDDEDQDILELLCEADWARVTFQDDVVLVDARRTVFRLTVEPPQRDEALEVFFEDATTPVPYGGPGPVHLAECTDMMNTDHQAPDCPLPVVDLEVDRMSLMDAAALQHQAGVDVPVVFPPIHIRKDGVCVLCGQKISERDRGRACPGSASVVDEVDDTQSPEVAATEGQACPCGCGEVVVNNKMGRQRVYATDGCRRRVHGRQRTERDRAAREANRAAPTPVVESEPVSPPVVDKPEPVAPEPRVARCARCDREGHYVEDCPQPMGGRKTKKDPVKPLSTPVDTQPEPLESKRVVVQGLPQDVTDDVLDKTANQYREQYAQGYPHAFTYLPDVLALYGVTSELVESAVRNPERVEVRPESFDKVKRHPVLSFSRGDVQAIMGLRDPMNPCIIAVYVTALLEHDTHRVSHTGGGGAKKDVGVPTTPAKVAQRLRAMGAKVAVDSRQDTALVIYGDQELGKIQTGGNTAKLTCQADFQRMQRKMHAIDRREGVSA